MSDVILRVDADTRQAEAKIGKLGNKSINLNTKNFNQPLGRITGQLGEFEKSLEASNARVIAFGASAGAIFAIERALTQTVRSAIDVEKSLTDINVILNLSSESLGKFGASLFEIARNTGNTFKTVADAATELSRQGLGVEETLKRTENALILTRLSGLGAADAVEALTATINGFSKEALNATEIVNKFAAVDAAFAVSSADLAEAVKRVGSSASDAGVSLDQLIAIVTSAQQITARGGAVIGNSFKTIFTRLQRTDTLEALEGLGIATRDAEGNFLPLINVIQQLGRTYDTLSDAQKASIAETVGGVFQINILKAALSDLGKEYSIYGRALQISSSATDEAARRNEELNKTFSSLLNKTLANLTQAGAKLGKEAFLPGIEKILQPLNSFLEDFSSKDTEVFGARIGQGLVSGIGSFLSGPGILLAGKALFVIFERLAIFSADALKTILGLNAKAAEQAQLQRQIFDLLSKNPQIIAQINQGSLSVQQTQSIILQTIQQQTAAMQQQIGLAKTLASSLSQSGVSIARTGMNKGVMQAKYAGYIPNFANQDQLIESLGAAKHGYKAGRAYKKTLYDGLGGSFPAVVNSAETIKTFKNSMGKKATIVEPPNGFSQGYIPNFARTRAPKISRGKTADIMTYSDDVSMIFPKKAGLGRAVGFGESMGKSIGVQFPIAGFNPKLAIKPEDSILEKRLGDSLVNFTNDFIEKIFMSTQGEPLPGKLTSPEQLSNAGSFKSIVGTVFETAVDFATRQTQADRKQNASIDFMSPSSKLKLLFNNAPGMYEAKNNALPANLDKTAQKIIDNGYLPENVKNQLGEKYKEESKARRIAEQVKAGMRKKPGAKKYSGFIPNFSALNDAVQREKNAGVNSTLIRIGRDAELISNSNPMGLGVYNTRDEPNGLKQGISRSRSSGFIPNFAETQDPPRLLQAYNPEYRKNVLMAQDRAFIKTEESKKPLNKLATTIENTSKKAIVLGKSLTETTESLDRMKGRVAAAGFGLVFLNGMIKEFGGDNALAKLSSGATEAGITFSTVSSVIPGKLGVMVGGFAAAGQAAYNIAKYFELSRFEDFGKEFEKARENFSKASDSTQKYLSTLEALNSAQKRGDTSTFLRLEEELKNIVSNMPTAYQDVIKSANSLAEAQAKLAELIAQQSKETQGKEFGAIVSGASKDYSIGDFLKKGLIEGTKSINPTIAAGVTKTLKLANIDLEDLQKRDIFSRNQQEGKRAGGVLFGGLSTENQNRIVQDLNNGNLKLIGTQAEVISKLKEYGVSTGDLAILTELSSKDLAVLTQGFVNSAKTLEKLKKLQEERGITTGKQISVEEQINKALAFQRYSANQELRIQSVRGLAQAYKPFAKEEDVAATESLARQKEIELEGEKKLNELRSQYQEEYEEAAAQERQLKQEVLQKQAEINLATQTALALEQQRLEITRKEIELQRQLASFGGAQGLLDPSVTIDPLKQIDTISKQLQETTNPITRGTLEARRLTAYEKLGVDISSPAFAQSRQNIVSGRTQQIQNALSFAQSRTGTTSAQAQEMQKVSNQAEQTARLQTAALTKDFSLVADSAQKFVASLNQTSNALGQFQQAVNNAAQNAGLTPGGTTAGGGGGGSGTGRGMMGTYEVKGTINVQHSPLVIRIEGNVAASLDPVNQSIIEGLKRAVSEIERKINSQGLLQSKIGPAPK